MDTLADKAVIVTGAGSGIGRAYALAMAAEGARVVVNDLGVDASGEGADPSRAAAVAREIRDAGGDAVADHADVSDFDAAGALVAAALGEFGRLDALVNNAAVEFRGTLEEHGAESWDRVMAVNARGTFNGAHHVARVMRERGGGAILNTTSGAFWEGTEGVAAYAASKAAVFALTLTQHTELARHGIRSNCIAPGATRTRMLDGWLTELSKSTDRAEEEVAAEYGIQEPENLAPLAVALCGDGCRGISGHVFEVTGERLHVMAPPRRVAGLERRGETWSVDELVAALPSLVERGAVA